MDERLAYIVTTLTVGAAIGGFTNALAIRMLFRPRRAWRIAGLRVPFTPGLIPKRRDDIAQALGRIVAEHLVTPEGLVGRLREASFQEKLADGLRRRLEALAGEGATVGDALARLTGATVGWEERLADAVRTWAGTWWTASGIAGRRPSEWIPQWRQRHRGMLTETLADAVVGAAKDMLRSPSGERLLRRLVAEAFDRLGGVWGSLAGMFLDGEKTARALRDWLDLQLGREAFRRTVVEAVDRRLAGWEDRTVGEWLERWTGRPADEAFRKWLDSTSLPEDAVRRLASVRIDRLLAAVGATERGETWAASAVRLLVRVCELQAERLVRDLDLSGLVAGQVARFSTERLERLLLDVSGREFRSITWLGALLGGLVGLAQGILSLVWL